MSKIRCLTRNIAKSGEVLNWDGFSPFWFHFGLIVNSSQSASCHITNRQTVQKLKQIVHNPVNAIYFKIRVFSTLNYNQPHI